MFLQSWFCFQIWTLNMQLFDMFICFYIVIVLYFKLYNVSYTSCLANELRAWLLYYSLPCLSGISPQPFLDHFAHLVEVIHLFLGTVISPNDISKGQEHLTYFYKNLVCCMVWSFFSNCFYLKRNLPCFKKYATVFVARFYSKGFIVHFICVYFYDLKFEKSNAR